MDSSHHSYSTNTTALTSQLDELEKYLFNLGQEVKLNINALLHTLLVSHTFNLQSQVHLVFFSFIFVCLYMHVHPLSNYGAVWYCLCTCAVQFLLLYTI